MMDDHASDDGSGAPDRPDLDETDAGAHLRYASDVIEVVETYLYRPALGFFMTIVTAAKRLQSGRLDAYLLYMLIVLVAVIAVVTAMARWRPCRIRTCRSAGPVRPRRSPRAGCTWPRARRGPGRRS